VQFDRAASRAISWPFLPLFLLGGPHYALGLFADGELLGFVCVLWPFVNNVILASMQSKLPTSDIHHHHHYRWRYYR
jgi:hypothetical protein